ncbi:hypothetical protein CAI21_08540 [Alkalilimnicola ehrlichii]|uniref:Uncharacterized protein n=1 Tax=Alkalilimnicola ehrlichii TaxID=351052 RepID=A0A3E0WWC0_9GAMM|nr:hypothetical protein [Alkalilimnicola ehrlichii]RFA29872.1 hypothetical protein CAI21_08540 [Alkalilimnicola ehrlichii]RFA36461.1 hypothetical protein CAL65_10810 [Alkalilimnicola ehrlichii]
MNIIPADKGGTHAFLRLHDLDYDWLDIPLGELKAQPRDELEEARSEESGQGENIVIPIVPYDHGAAAAYGVQAAAFTGCGARGCATKPKTVYSFLWGTKMRSRLIQ